MIVLIRGVVVFIIYFDLILLVGWIFVKFMFGSNVVYKYIININLLRKVSG